MVKLKNSEIPKYISLSSEDQINEALVNNLSISTPYILGYLNSSNFNTESTRCLIEKFNQAKVPFCLSIFLIELDNDLNNIGMIINLTKTLDQIKFRDCKFSDIQVDQIEQFLNGKLEIFRVEFSHGNFSPKNYDNLIKRLTGKFNLKRFEYSSLSGEVFPEESAQTLKNCFSLEGITNSTSFMKDNERVELEFFSNEVLDSIRDALHDNSSLIDFLTTGFNCHENYNLSSNELGFFRMFIKFDEELLEHHIQLALNNMKITDRSAAEIIDQVNQVAYRLEAEIGFKSMVDPDYEQKELAIQNPDYTDPNSIKLFVSNQIKQYNSGDENQYIRNALLKALDDFLFQAEQKYLPTRNGFAEKFSEYLDDTGVIFIEYMGDVKNLFEGEGE